MATTRGKKNTSSTDDTKSPTHSEYYDKFDDEGIEYLEKVKEFNKERLKQLKKDGKKIYDIDDMVITPKKTILENITLIENIDKNQLERLLYTDTINQLTIHYTSENIYKTLKDQLELLFVMLESNNKHQIMYKRSSKGKGYGRVSGECNNRPALSLGNLRREIRHAFSKDYYYDIDIKNCHPVMLYQLCERWGLTDTAINLKKYIENRENCFTELRKYIKQNDNQPLTRDMCKTLPIILMYGGSVSSWKEDNNLKGDITKSKFWSGFIEEIEILKQAIMYPNKEFWNLINDEEVKPKTKKEKNKEEVNKYFNPLGRAMSYYLQEYENRVLECVYIYLKENGYIPKKELVLCWDGFMLPKKHFKEGLLEKLSNEIFEKVGFKFEFDIKEMNEGDEVLKDILSIKPDYEKIDIFSYDKEVFDDILTYCDKKEYFELFSCKIKNPQIIVFRHNTKTTEEKEEDNKIFKCKYSDFKNSFNELKCRYLVLDKLSGKPIWIKDEFCMFWLNDTNINISPELTFYPKNITNKEVHLEARNRTSLDAYNLFTGYNENIRKPYNKIEGGSEALRRWFEIVKELCEGEDYCMNYYIKWLSHKVRYPHKKLAVALVFKSLEGTGKNLHLKPIKNIIGKYHYIEGANPETFFGTHATGFVNKILVVMNEACSNSNGKFESTMKEYITDDTIKVNEKHIPQYELRNFFDLIVFSNKGSPIKIDATARDRRWVAFQSTDKYSSSKYTTDGFWKQTANLFDTDEFTAELYDFLCSIDLTDFNEKKRPLTAFYYHLCRLNLDHNITFIEDYYYKNVSKYLRLLDENGDVKEDENDEDYKEVNKSFNAWKYRNDNEKLTLRDYIEEKKIEKVRCNDFYNEFISYLTAGRLCYENDIPKIHSFNKELVELQCGIDKLTDREGVYFSIDWSKVYRVLKDKDRAFNEKTILERKKQLEEDFKEERLVRRLLA